MKSLLSLILIIFSVVFLSAQEISEDQFIPQLQAKQKVLYELVDKKDSLTILVSNLTREIENIKDEAEKAEKIKVKNDLENKVKILDTDITKKCDEYREYHTLLSKYQNVSDEFLATYKVRICQIYTSPVITPEQVEEVKADSFKEKLKAKEVEIEEKVDKKFNSDKKIAVFDKEIAALESKLNVSTLEDGKRKEIEDKIKALKEKKVKEEKDNEDFLKEIRNLCEKFEDYKKYLLKHEGLKETDLKDFKARSCLLFSEEEKPIDYTKFIIIGDNEPIEADKLLNNDTTKKALTDIFSIDSKTNLGTFEIPGDKEPINFYVWKKIKEDTTDRKVMKMTSYSDFSKKASSKLITAKEAVSDGFTFAETPVTALFKSIQVELLEGGIVDIRLVLESVDGKTHFYFEGTDPVSLLNYSRKASQRAVLKFSHYVSKNGDIIYNEKALSNLLVKFIEVLDYHPNAGSNYVPDDISYTFPSKEESEAKITDRRSYQVINNNHLQHVLDLRTYTDMLGLFGDEANGLFQIEGKADFFINPFNIPREAVYYFKKVSPYVRYSRFDEDEDFITTTLNTGTSEYNFNDKKLELLERSTLEMGLEMNLLTFRLVKESPFWISLNTPLTYNVTRIQADASAEKSNFKTLGYGANIMLDIKRFNNFGLMLGYELKGYSYLGDYSDVNLTEPSFLKTQAVKAEIFYYPGLDKSQSVFLRMKSIKDVSSGNADSFFQLQVGYRFTLGVGAIKAK